MLVYNFKCRGCSTTFYGKTKRYFKVKMCEHFEVFTLTGKRVKGSNDSAIKEHRSFSFDGFAILASNNNNFKIILIEGLLIDKDHPPLNKSNQSLLLELFDEETKFHQKRQLTGPVVAHGYSFTT